MDPPRLLSIGVLAARFGTTARALRHYDRLGLFRPSVVEPGTGNRLYGTDQLEDLELIVRLRTVDLPLEDIRSCLNCPAGQLRQDRINELLHRHRVRLESRHSRIRFALHQLDHLTTDLTGGHSLMTNDGKEIDHRALGIELFNATWTLMDKDSRTLEEDDAMLHMAHASAHHWRSEGSGATPNNLARSEWQVSRMYTVLRRPEPAAHHARRCLEICQANGIGDWDIAYAYEALARAAGIAGDTETARSWADQAHRAAEDIAEDEERRMLLLDLETLPGLTPA
ncbi:MAG: MerR family transcriptional regulator [Actinomycetota bacterium]|nr:MerR family transcriptional regulator [Actinomycetota bacterium]MDQ2955792.1 MerR family transcriptional regulator [Actinomycetota bacterium]